MASSKSSASETREGEGAEITSMENKEDLQSTGWKGGRGKSYRGTPRFRSGSWVKEGAVRGVGVQEDEQVPCMGVGKHVPFGRVMSAGLELRVEDAFEEDIWVPSAGLSDMPHITGPTYLSMGN